MQVIARASDIKTSTRKVRLVADSIRGLGLLEAQDALTVIQKKGANDLEKVLKSAIANAVNNSGLEKNNLVIKTIDVNEGTSLKRFHPSTRGRVHPYKKRTSNIRIILEEKVASQPKIEAKSELKAIEAKATDAKGETNS